MIPITHDQIPVVLASGGLGGLSLPREVVLHVIDFLGLPSINALTHVSRRYCIRVKRGRRRKDARLYPVSLSAIASHREHELLASKHVVHVFVLSCVCAGCDIFQDINKAERCDNIKISRRKKTHQAVKEARPHGDFFCHHVIVSEHRLSRNSIFDTISREHRPVGRNTACENNIAFPGQSLLSYDNLSRTREGHSGISALRTLVDVLNEAGVADKTLKDGYTLDRFIIGNRSQRHVIAASHLAIDCDVCCSKQWPSNYYHIPTDAIWAFDSSSICDKKSWLIKFRDLFNKATSANARDHYSDDGINFVMPQMFIKPLYARLRYIEENHEYATLSESLHFARAVRHLGTVLSRFDAPKYLTLCRDCMYYRRSLDDECLYQFLINADTRVDQGDHALRRLAHLYESAESDALRRLVYLYEPAESDADPVTDVLKHVLDAMMSRYINTYPLEPF